MLEIYDKQLVDLGLIIQKKRKNIIFSFNQIFSSLFEEVTGIEGVNISYHSSWKEKEEENKKIFPASQEIFNTLLSQREKEKEMETTISGPHRDRIDFVKDHKFFIPTASTGQCRLISLILRVAQAVFYTRATNLKPVILMDDVLLELDPSKRTKITAHLPDYDQLICTFLPGEPYEHYMHDTTKVYKIEQGAWYE